MANLVTVSDNKKVTVLVQPPGNVQVQISRTPMGVAVANVANTAHTVINNNQPNITSVGTLANLNVAGSVSIGGNLQIGNLVANSANYSNFAGNAFSVSGSNVVGSVQQSNVANVANIANVANSVSVANVIGIGNIATQNYNGVGNTFLAGNGVWANISINSVANANYANFANLSNSVEGYVKVPFQWNDASPKTIATVPADSVVSQLEIIINTPFGGSGSSMSVGTVANVNLLASSGDIVTTVSGTYSTFPGVKFASNSFVVLSINPGTSTVGSGMIVIYF